MMPLPPMKPPQPPFKYVVLTGFDQQVFRTVYENCNGHPFDRHGPDTNLLREAWQAWLPYLRGELT